MATEPRQQVKQRIQQEVKRLAGDINLIQQDSTLAYLFSNFLGYSSHLIQEQAIPQFFDGLLPSQRGHLLSMQDLGMANSKKHQKSTRVVAHQTGTYRPVGNTYDVLVNMSQDWRTQVLLTDPEGGWGPQESGKASAERYTETRLSVFAEKIALPDTPQRLTSDKTPHNIVPTSINEFGTHWVEQYLPVRLPLILINGNNGIAVGLSQTWQPFSYTTLLPQIVSFINTGKIDYTALKFGYPTECLIANRRADIEQALKTGSGSVRTAGKYELVKKGMLTEAVVFTSVPPHITLNAIGDAFQDNKRNFPDFPFDSYRNESSRGQIRLVFKFRNPTPSMQVVEEAVRTLYKRCKLMDHQTINMVALKNNFPIKYSLETFLEDWVAERAAILVRLSQNQLAQLSRDKRRLDVLTFAKRHETDVLDILHNSETESLINQAFTNLAERKYPGFGWAEDDTKILLQINLRQLSKLDESEHQKKLQKIKEAMDSLQSLIDSPSQQRLYITNEIQDFYTNRAKMGVRDLVCEYDENLANFLDSKPQAQKFTFPGKPGVTPVTSQAAVTYLKTELGAAASPDILVYTKSGLTYLFRGHSVRQNMETKVALLQDDKIAQAFFCSNENIPFITGEGRVIFIDKDQLPTGTPITANKIFSLQKSKATGDDLKFCIPFCVQGTKSLLLAHRGLIKRLDAAELNSIRQKITLPFKPDWVAIADDVLSADPVINLAPIKPVSYKQVARLPSGYNSAMHVTLKTVSNKMKLVISSDQTSISKAPA